MHRQKTSPPTVEAYKDWAVNVKGLGKNLAWATVKQIGMTAATTALNAAINMGIGLLVSSVINGVIHLITAQQKAIESARELKEEYKEFQANTADTVASFCKDRRIFVCRLVCGLVMFIL